MIYKKYLLLGVSLCMLNACNESKSVSLEGSLDGIQADSIYLYQVDNEHYGSVKLIKSIAVTDGRFAYPTDSIQVGLYCFSLQNMERGEYLQQYANLFLEPKSMHVQCNLFDCLGCTVVSAVLHCLYAIFQQRLCAACCQCNACLFLQCQLMISASCGESYLCFLTHAIADACPQECSGCFCDNLCRDEDMYGGSVHAEEGAELMVGVVVNPQRGVTSACRCNGGECEVRLIHSVCQQLACVDCLAAAQTENHICIFHDFILFQFIYSLEGCFTGEQDIINLYNTVLCCFIQIFLCCVDRNFITDDNSLWAEPIGYGC